MFEFKRNIEGLSAIYKVFYVIMFIFIINLINLQIINYATYFQMSEKNRVRRIPRLGPRGSIITSDEVFVARNKPSYTVIYFPMETSSNRRLSEIAKRLAKASNLDYKAIYELKKEVRWQRRAIEQLKRGRAKLSPEEE